jgi:hypothetical protein
MCNDSACQASPELASAPETENEQRKLEKAMRFSHAKPSANSHSLSLFANRILLSLQSRNCHNMHLAQLWKAVFTHINAAQEDGSAHWRKAKRKDLMDVLCPRRVSQDEVLRKRPDSHDASTLNGATNATWGAHRSHSRSAGGVVFLYAEGDVFCRWRCLPTIALSSTEAEFATMADAGKAALICLRMLRSDMGFIQEHQMQANNRGKWGRHNSQHVERDKSM